jgi:hypothetical protein
VQKVEPSQLEKTPAARTTIDIYNRGGDKLCGKDEIHQLLHNDSEAN